MVPLLEECSPQIFVLPHALWSTVSTDGGSSRPFHSAFLIQRCPRPWRWLQENSSDAGLVSSSEAVLKPKSAFECSWKRAGTPRKTSIKCGLPADSSKSSANLD